MNDEWISLETRLESFLWKRDREIIPVYDEYRSLLREIREKLGLSPTMLPLFPERHHGVQLKKELFKKLGKSYDGKPVTKAPPWAGKGDEEWIESEAIVEELRITGHGCFHFKYTYTDPTGITHSDTDGMEFDSMGAPIWRWDSTELQANFGAGKTIPCRISMDNFARHKIWTPY